MKRLYDGADWLHIYDDPQQGEHVAGWYKLHPVPKKIVCNYCGRGPADGQALRCAGPGFRVCKGGHLKEYRRARANPTTKREPETQPEIRPVRFALSKIPSVFIAFEIKDRVAPQ